MSTTFDYSSATTTAEKSDTTPDRFKLLEYREQLYAIDIDGLAETKFDKIVLNNLNDGEDNSLLDYEIDRENIDIDAFVYNPRYEEFKEVDDKVVNEILEKRLGI